MRVFKKTLILLSTILLCACGVRTGNGPIDALVTGATGIYKTQGAGDNCTQEHPQDRINCRKKKESDVEAISKSIKKHTDPQEVPIQ